MRYWDPRIYSRFGVRYNAIALCRCIFFNEFILNLGFNKTLHHRENHRKAPSFPFYTPTYSTTIHFERADWFIRVLFRTLFSPHQPKGRGNDEVVVFLPDWMPLGVVGKDRHTTHDSIFNSIRIYGRVCELLRPSTVLSSAARSETNARHPKSYTTPAASQQLARVIRSLWIQ